MKKVLALRRVLTCSRQNVSPLLGMQLSVYGLDDPTYNSEMALRQNDNDDWVLLTVN